MNRLKLFLIFVLSAVFLFSCMPEDEEDVVSSDKEDTTENGNDNKNDNEDDGSKEGDENGDDNNESEEEDNSGSEEEEDDDNGSHYNECEPGETQECYDGPSGTAGVGICKKGTATCFDDGAGWTECEDQVLPEPEICGDDIDQNCDGQDWIKGGEMDIDIDGDGYTYCDGDCCEFPYECPETEPERINPGAHDFPNGRDDNCNGEVDSSIKLCDSDINSDTSDPVDLVNAMDLCPVTEDKPYGLISAEISFPDETGISEVPENQYSVLTSFGNTIVPNTGSAFAALSSGNATDPIGDSNVDNETSSSSPQDWYSANGNKYPTPPDCGFATQDSGDPANDPVMLSFKVKAPVNAESFSFDIYFFSIEFHDYVCSQYNDFFVALLDSDFETDNPEHKNPEDKNLAMDENGNPVGINLAMNGLFTVCDQKPMVAPQKTKYCEGSEPLNGTGFEGHGATGWLTTRGNIIPGEEFEVRLAIWDAGDHVLDSMIVIDNWQWQETAEKPGTDKR